MFAYWLMFSMFAAGSFGKLRTTSFSPLRAPLFALAVVVLVLLVGLRYEVGGDWIPYQLIFEGIQERPWAEIAAYGDPGYMLLNRLADALGAGVWLVNLVCAALFTWGLARFSEEQPNPWLAMAIAVPYLVIVVAMGYTRQAVAIGLLMAAIPCFQDRRYLRFFCYVIVAAAFHKTVIVMLPLIALSSARNRFLIYSSTAIIAAALFLFFIGVFLDALVTNYVDTSMKSEGAGIRIAMSATAALLFLPFQRHFARNDEERLLWRNVSLVALLMVGGLAISASSTVVDRISLYLIPLQIFVLSRLPLAFSRNGRPSQMLTFGVLGYSAAIQFVWLNFASHSYAWIPYRMFVLS